MSKTYKDFCDNDLSLSAFKSGDHQPSQMQVTFL